MTPTKTEQQNEQILERLKELHEVTLDCQKVMRGSGNEPGFIARVINLETAFEKLGSNELAHLKSDLLEKMNQLEEKLDKKLKDLEDDTPTFKKIFSKLINPVVIALLTAILIAVVLHLLNL